jgi:hypothetical protein
VNPDIQPLRTAICTWIPCFSARSFSDPGVVAGERRPVRRVWVQTRPGELSASQEPWARDPSHHLYEALLPATELRLDNPAVELFHERRGADEIAVLVNHTARRHVATLRSARPLRAADFFDSRPAGEGEAIDLDLEPAGVRVWRLHALKRE